MFWLVVGTIIAGFACYGVGLLLRVFRPGYSDFRYRLSLPIIACCVGSIAALVLMSKFMDYFLIDQLYRVALVRQHPGFVIGALDFAAYAFGGYYFTKYAVLFAHRLDSRRNAKNNYQVLHSPTGISLSEVGRELFKVEEPTKTSHKGINQ